MLTSLGLACCSIGTTGAAEIAEYMSGSEAVTTLDIGMNLIFAEGAKAIGEALKVNEGAKALGGALAVNAWSAARRRVWATVWRRTSNSSATPSRTKKRVGYPLTSRRVATSSATVPSTLISGTRPPPEQSRRSVVLGKEGSGDFFPDLPAHSFFTAAL
ncbi:hypothetical protein EMIHUDRAFT_226248 [Emiliania huxleyi CCMP1516]|uniref:Uncharacterized protein n=2 Tax=Emiliania huxleyi TaxID=2903 RepID=A0A0D3KL57_EMIH1|nr:hypothetical protein EMIHUDRAFT_226248 [Emiliania huxleyi CCMP1516]EOD36492.1 hypothetical protein EMIHUDRAFT_226248 [Emiliania huxleyi CCMP1516]|eukprot:XP_005788921.1 hypothetical protein EMIHUDRAFT_226248 [Emiliania huxleyi CCMP1516]